MSLEPRLGRRAEHEVGQISNDNQFSEVRSSSRVHPATACAKPPRNPAPVSLTGRRISGRGRSPAGKPPGATTYDPGQLRCQDPRQQVPLGQPTMALEDNEPQ